MNLEEAVIAALLAVLPLTPLINWPVFVVLMLAPQTTPYSKALNIMRLLSFAIALLSTVYAGMVFATLFHVELQRGTFTFLMTFPVLLFTAVNAAFLWITVKGKW